MQIRLILCVLQLAAFGYSISFFRQLLPEGSAVIVSHVKRKMRKRQWWADFLTFFLWNNDFDPNKVTSNNFLSVEGTSLYENPVRVQFTIVNKKNQKNH